MPAHGLGTWKSKPSEVYEAVKTALDLGYNHIDCALVYENEHEVGHALKEKVGKVIAREELWVTSKLWNTHREFPLIRPALKKTLSDLGLTYLDLYLIHWPQDFPPGDKLFPKNADGSPLFGKTDYVEVWKELEMLVEEGLVRNIGVSNFNHTQIDRILAMCRIKPAVNQVECHPYLTQEKLSAYCKEKGIVITSYAPLGAPDFAKPTDPVLLQDPWLTSLASKYGKTPAQILLRFHIDRGLVVIPKSVNPKRIAENLHIFDFSLAPEDLHSLLGLNQNFRYYPASGEKAHPHYPFNAEY